MASVNGTAALPLPDAIVDGLAQRGYREVVNPVAGTFRYANPDRRDLTVVLVRSNIPGDPAVTVQWPNAAMPTRRMDPDKVLELIDYLNPPTPVQAPARPNVRFR